MLAIVIYKRGFAPATTEMRSIIRAAMILGVLSTALPFTLIAWGETKIDSGVAAIGNASMPIFVALLALRFRKSERATGSKAVGVVLGLIGVGVLAGVNPEGGWAGVAGTLAVIVASISYAVSTLYIQTLLDNVHNDVLAAASVTWGAIFLTPSRCRAGAVARSELGRHRERARPRAARHRGRASSSTSGSSTGTAPRGPASSSTSCL